MPYNRIVDLSALDDRISEILGYLYHADVENHHETHIWPSQPDINMVLTAGAVNNAWSGWARLIDSGGDTFWSSDENIHITSVLLESASAGTDIYFIELSYTSLHHTITRIRFSSAGVGQLPPLHMVRIRSQDVPMGNMIYYRCKCETGGATVNIALRYHHDYEIAHGFNRPT